LKLLFFRKNFI